MQIVKEDAPEHASRTALAVRILEDHHRTEDSPHQGPGSLYLGQSESVLDSELDTLLALLDSSSD